MLEIIYHPFLLQAILFSILFYFILKRFHKSPPTTASPPSPPKLPILGNLHQLTSLPHHDLRRLSNKYGPLMLLRFGTVPTLIVSSAAAAREVMKTHDIAFADRPQSSVSRRLLYNGRDVSIAPYGEYWRQLKSICVLQLLCNKRVESFHSIREEETAVLVEKIRSRSGGEVLNLSDMFGQVTNDVVCRSAFGRKYSEGQKGEKFLRLLREFLEVLGAICVGDFVPCLRWIDWVNGFDAKVDRLRKELDEFLEEVIEERLGLGLGNKFEENFVDILLEIHRNGSTGVSIDRDSIKAIILDVFAAGTDTTSTVLEWAMTELLQHPDAMLKLQNEVREIAKHKEKLTSIDLEKMSYLHAVLKETLRLHTPIPLLVARVARENVKLMGYDISKGTMVMINAWAIGRDPKCWEEPEKFNPDRFLHSKIDFKGLDFELIPFGSGRRGCPGISFAMTTNELVLANLVQKFEWKSSDERNKLDMSERPGVAIHKVVPLLAIAIEYQY